MRVKAAILTALVFHLLVLTVGFTWDAAEKDHQVQVIFWGAIIPRDELGRVRPSSGERPVDFPGVVIPADIKPQWQAPSTVEKPEMSEIVSASRSPEDWKFIGPRVIIDDENDDLTKVAPIQLRPPRI